LHLRQRDRLLNKFHSRLHARLAAQRRLGVIGVLVIACVVVLAAGPRVADAAAAATTWTNVAPASSPSPRIDGAAAYDAATKQLVVFGGVDSADDFLADTWTWNGATWKQWSPPASPSPRGGAQMAYDTATGQLILFGGNTGTGSSETWTWTGSTWTQLHPAASPPPESSEAMAYDPATKQILIFGGFRYPPSGPVASNDTWAWNGTTWTKLAPATVPPTRTAAAMGYDAATSQLVLYGGLNQASGSLSDTWLWNGSDWIAKHPNPYPGPRSAMSLTYDGLTRQLLLVGGLPDLGGVAGDTWSWNGTTWVQLNPRTPLDPRWGQQAAYDGANRELVVFGGANNGRFQNDTWLFGPLAIPPQTPPPATVGARYSAVLNAIAGIGSDTWSVTSNSLPAGLSLSPTGVITGTPTTAGKSTFTVTAMDSESPVAQATRTLTLKVNPPPPAAVWVINGGNNVINSFPLAASGNAPPSATISGTSANLNSLGGIAVDKTGAVYVSNAGTPSIAIFAPGAHGNIAPIRTIAGSDTGLSVPMGIALDDAGQLYVTNAGDNSITVYAAGANGDAQPVQTISGLDTELSQPMGVVIDAGGHIWAANATANLLTEYAAGATGDAVPIGTFRGLASTLNYPIALAQDASGRILAANIFGESVTAFTPGPPFGNVAPVFTISGAQSQLSYPRGLDVDNANNLYVANQFGGINVYAPNTASPSRVIAGAATGLAYPRSLAVAPPLTIATTTLPPAAVGRRYTAPLIADLATTPTRWRLVHGQLPKGVKLAASGLIAGVPSRVGTFHITVAVTDSTKQAMHARQKLTLIVKRPPTVNGVRPPRGAPTGRARVTITGSGFRTAPGATSFAFARLRALAVHCSSHKRCIAVVPPHAPGSVHVTATAGGLSSTPSRHDRYTYTR
jgi:hypothetical protein